MAISARCWSVRSSSTPGPIYVWLPGLVCLLALAELTCGAAACLLVAFATGHIGATLLVAAGLTAAVELGWLPTSVSRRPTSA